VLQGVQLQLRDDGLVQVLRDAEVVIQLIASDTDVEGTGMHISRAILI